MIRNIMSVTILCAVLAAGQSLSADTVYRNLPGLLSFQGYLTDDRDIPINRPVPMVISIYSASSGGVLLWSETHASENVAGGIFRTTLGAITPIPDSIFSGGTDRWVQIQVDANIMTPRTRLAAAPYVFHTVNADTALYSYNAASDGDWVRSTPDSVLFTARHWGLSRGGSSNMLWGTQQKTHVNFGIACTTGVNSVNYSYGVIAGGYHNAAGQAGSYATIAGGAENSATGGYSTIGGGYSNEIPDYWSTIAGGYNNMINSRGSGILAGYNNVVGDTVLDSAAVVVGGRTNSALGKYSFVGSGQSNTAGGDYAVAVGGRDNTAAGNYAVVCGGDSNQALTDYAVIGGGSGDTVRALWGTILHGFGNIAGDQLTDTCALIGGGKENRALAKFTFIGGGWGNTATALYSTIIGGQNNQASNNYTAIGGGLYNRATGPYAIIAGGDSNLASASYSVVGGGRRNVATGAYSMVAGGDMCQSAGTYAFTVCSLSKVPSSYSNSVALNGQTVTASNQTRVGILTKAGGTFTIDHPLDPDNKILNHYFVESPEMVLIYQGETRIGPDGRVEVALPDYFDALTRNPMISLTGIGGSDVYIVRNVENNRFVIGGTPGIEVDWLVTAERKDESSEIIRILLPVEQLKEDELKGHSLNDDFLAATRMQLEEMGKAGGFKFRTEEGRKKYEVSKKALETEKK